MPPSHDPGDAPTDSEATDSPQLILAHYLPWYSDNRSSDASDHWRHWRGSKPAGKLFCPPETIASKYYPLLEPYDSGDELLQLCHLALMRHAGFDGAIINWMGPQRVNDHAALHANTASFVSHLSANGFSFAICFDLHTVLTAHVCERQPDYLDGVVRELEGFFQRSGYVMSPDGRPVLLVFGNPSDDSDEGRAMSSVLERLASRLSDAVLVTQDRQRPKAGGAFLWPPVHREDSTSKIQLSSPEFIGKLDAFNGKRDIKLKVGLACPGFKDIYEKDPGLGRHNLNLERHAGKTYCKSLLKAITSGARIIQVATWNDWQEGTVVEPARGGFDNSEPYRELSATRQIRRKKTDSKLDAQSTDDLCEAVRLYRDGQHSRSDARRKLRKLLDS